MATQEELNQLRLQVEQQVKKEVHYRQKMTVVVIVLAFFLMVSLVFAFFQKAEADAQQEVAWRSVIEAADCRKSAEEARRLSEQQVASALIQVELALQKAQEEATKRK